MKIFKDKLRYLREHQELSQMEVARRLNLNQPRYSRYETGTYQPDIDTLKKISQFFDVNNFILSGRYTINSRVPSDRERKMLNNVIASIFADN